MQDVVQDVVQEAWVLGGGAMRFHRAPIQNMRVMALTANTGLRLRVGEMRIVLSFVSYSLFYFCSDSF